MKKHQLMLVVACALIDVDNRVLLSQRPQDKAMAGLWEFPGGKLEPGETPEETLVRELYEEVGVTVQAQHLTPFIFASHAYDNFHLLMPLYTCRQFATMPVAKEGQVLQWVAECNLADYPMPAADIPFVPALRAFLSSSKYVFSF